ncbi:hypothetical protein M427DRAFT_59006 [Gonapodya prolifera JEL478]|uniref:F-box domain-containing protein n=1 Tax=Gonapodya prolifera (strain JEL478) TaxID=1344416 RepID=A0A139A8J5_GONPJ|nr:hypothetical protein M427DRAFT_59006 [Gonapodya prolifera JEL478]|eukprot:KXS13110.1 hypothetical protein M427DRAFT_59006 [Gonapodya prolifera JEL478]
MLHPPELLLAIFVQLNAESLLASSLVSHSWRESALHILVSNPPLRSRMALVGYLDMLSRHLYLRDSVNQLDLDRIGDPLGISEFQRIAEFAMPRLRKLTLPRQYRLLSAFTERDSTVQSLLASAERLESLDCASYAFGEDSFRTLNDLPTVTSLTRVFISTRRDSELLCKFIERHPKIVKLGVDGFPDTYGDDVLLALCQYSTELHDFSVGHSWNVSPDAAVEFIGKRGPSMTGLSARATPGFFSLGVLQGLSQATRLQCLSLCCGSTVYALSSDSLRLLCRTISPVRVLVLQRQVHLDGDILTRLCERLAPTLVGLDVSGCVLLPEESLLDAFGGEEGTRLERLEQLNLCDVPTVTDKVLNTLATHFATTLTCLDVGTTQITDQGLHNLVEECTDLQWLSFFTVGMEMPLTREAVKRKGIHVAESLFWIDWRLVGW